MQWVHRTRDDGREDPAEVLDWVYGQVWGEAALHRMPSLLTWLRTGQEAC